MSTMGKSEIQLKYLKMLETMLSAGTAIKFDGKGSEVIRKTPEIKLLIKEIKEVERTSNIEKVRKILAPGRSGPSLYAPIFNGLTWTAIDKSPFSGAGGGSPDAKTTKMQEKASLYSIKTFIEKNGAFTKDTFLKKHRSDLLEIYPDMDAEWENTFYEQGKKIQKEVGSTKFDHYDRDTPDGFMEKITKLAKSYGVTQKDNWNPADIWLVANYTAEKNSFLKKVKDDVTSIEEFNTELKHKFTDNAIIGISLKKLSGKTAQYEKVNLENSDMFYDDEYKFRFNKALHKLSVDPQGELNSSDTLIYLKGKKMSVKIQIRQQSSGFTPMKIEGTDINNKAAKLGKAPLDMVEVAFKAYGLKWNNNKTKFPMNATEFMKKADEFCSMFEELKLTGKIEFDGASTSAQFKGNMRKAFSGKKPESAHNKLMQISLLYEVFTKLKGDKLEEFWTDIVYFCQKKGAVFGPFGKLY
jgi:hypothetical protein